MDAATLAKLAELTLKLGEVTERINSLTAALVQFALALAADAKTLNDANVAVDTLYKIFANSGMTDAQIKANSDYIQQVAFRDNAQRQFDATERNYLGVESDLVKANIDRLAILAYTQAIIDSLTLCDLCV